jgi:ankyrin repeat protein
MKRWTKKLLAAAGLIAVMSLLLALPFLFRLHHYKAIRCAIENGNSATAVQRIQRLPKSYDLEWTLWEDISWIPQIGWLYSHIVGCPTCAADGYPLMWHAAMSGDVQVMDALMHKGALLKYKGDSGAQMLWAATQSANTNAILFLMRKGVDLRDPHISAIHVAAMNPSSLHVVRFLADYGADVNAPDWMGRTPLDYAYTWNTNAVPLLVGYGARLGTSDGLRVVNKTPNEASQDMSLRADPER